VTPENRKLSASQRHESTSENRSGHQPAPPGARRQELLDDYAVHFKHSPLLGASPRTYISAVRGYLAWLDGSSPDGDPLADPAARDWAVRDYRSYLVTVAKRSPATVNKVLSALDDFYTWCGLGAPTHCNTERRA
jgi:hypothetical protein